MSEISLSRSGPPETVLPPEPVEVEAALDAALASDDPRTGVSAVVADHPALLNGWAHLGELARDDIEAYAAFRVGYHRGLDRLRANGWRGSGYVRWQHPTNRGFLRALHGLATQARTIGELDEAERCDLFLRQLDPSWPPAELV
ncbi:MAG: DUF3151 family protein [Actinomycetota bacterium]